MAKINQKSQSFIRKYFAGTIGAQLAVVETMGPQLEKAADLVAASMTKGGKWLLIHEHVSLPGGG